MQLTEKEDSQNSPHENTSRSKSFFQNLSFKILEPLCLYFPDSLHVKDIGFEVAGDEVIWSYAKKNGFTILSKDVDFRHFSFLFGAPPKVIAIKKGEVSTEKIVILLKSSLELIHNFANNQEESILILE